MISKREPLQKTRWIKAVLIGTGLALLVTAIVAVFSIYDGGSPLGDTINESIKRRYKAIDDASSSINFEYQIYEVKMEDHLG